MITLLIDKINSIVFKFSSLYIIRFENRTKYGKHFLSFFEGFLFEKYQRKKPKAYAIQSITPEELIKGTQSTVQRSLKYLVSSDSKDYVDL